MKFLADVNISRHVVARRRSEGFDILRVPEFMDPKAEDLAILEEGRKRGAVVISQDQDFSALLAVSGATQPSLINVRVSSVDVAYLAETIAAVIRATEPDLTRGAIVTLDDAGVRVHALPI